MNRASEKYGKLLSAPKYVLWGHRKRRERQRGQKRIWRNNGWTPLHIQESQRAPKRSIPRHIIVKTLKEKKKILKAAREKPLITYIRTPIRLTADISL